ncbi:MAG: LysR substrate-binding domain-containing protein [Lachnospiraceae bacterium]
MPLDEILSHPFILTERNASYRLMLDRYLAAREQAIRPYLSIGNTEFIIRQLIGSSSLSFLPSFAIAPEEKKGLLCALDVDQFHMQVWRQVLHHKDKWVTREMEAFFQLLRS